MLQVMQACCAKRWTPQRSKFLCCLSFSFAFLPSTSFFFLLMLAVTVSDYYQSKVSQQTIICLGHCQNTTDGAKFEQLTCCLWVWMLAIPGCPWFPWLSLALPGQDTSRTSRSSTELSFHKCHHLPGSYMSSCCEDTNPYCEVHTRML